MRNRIFKCTFKNKYGFEIWSITFLHYNSFAELLNKINEFQRNFSDCRSIEIIEM